VTSVIYPNQNIAAKYLYAAFGGTSAEYLSLDEPKVHSFLSEEWNTNAGIYYCLYRFYDSNLQRWSNRDRLDQYGWQVEFGSTKSKRLLDQIERRHPWHALDMSGEVDEYIFVLNRPINEIDEAGLLSWQNTLCGAAFLAACEPCFFIQTSRGRAGCLLIRTTPCMPYSSAPGENRPALPHLPASSGGNVRGRAI